MYINFLQIYIRTNAFHNLTHFCVSDARVNNLAAKQSMNIKGVISGRCACEPSEPDGILSRWKQPMLRLCILKGDFRAFSTRPIKIERERGYCKSDLPASECGAEECVRRRSGHLNNNPLEHSVLDYILSGFPVGRSNSQRCKLKNQGGFSAAKCQPCIATESACVRTVDQHCKRSERRSAEQRHGSSG